jgi:hypothetical protein
MTAPIDRDSEPGSYADAMRYPPYAGHLGADGEFRRGFPAEDAPHRHETGAPGASAEPFHGQGR